MIESSDQRLSATGVGSTVFRGLLPITIIDCLIATRALYVTQVYHLNNNRMLFGRIFWLN